MFSAPGQPTDAIQAEVTALALEHRLMSPYTSFVAVDRSEIIVSEEEPATVHQALPIPDGVSFKGVFGPQGPPGLQEPDRAEVIDLDGFESATLTDQNISDLPIPGRLYVSLLTMSPGMAGPDRDGRPNLHGSRSRRFRTEVTGAGNVAPLTGQTHGRAGLRLAGATSAYALDAAFRVLADLAEDGTLSPSEGGPALAALLALQQRDGSVAGDVRAQAVLTWALSEAATAVPADPWIEQAVALATSHLKDLQLDGGWPLQRGGEPHQETTRWCRLILGWIEPELEAEEPGGPASERFERLRSALISDASSPVSAPSSRTPFDRLIAAIPRGHLMVAR